MIRKEEEEEGQDVAGAVATAEKNFGHIHTWAKGGWVGGEGIKF